MLSGDADLVTEARGRRAPAIAAEPERHARLAGESAMHENREATAERALLPGVGTLLRTSQQYFGI